MKQKPGAGAGSSIFLKILCSLHRPFRGLARSHRDRTGFKLDAVPVGAGKPAKRPVQVMDQLPATVIRSISTEPV